MSNKISKYSNYENNNDKADDSKTRDNIDFFETKNTQEVDTENTDELDFREEFEELKVETNQEDEDNEEDRVVTTDRREENRRIMLWFISGIFLIYLGYTGFTDYYSEFGQDASWLIIAIFGGFGVLGAYLIIRSLIIERRLRKERQAEEKEIDRRIEEKRKREEEEL